CLTSDNGANLRGRAILCNNLLNELGLNAVQDPVADSGYEVAIRKDGYAFLTSSMVSQGDDSGPTSPSNSDLTASYFSGVSHALILKTRL
ncbi:MAG: hypothetical protein M1823_008401, partial [Watsoniomyces obsoletus]